MSVNCDQWKGYEAVQRFAAFGKMPASEGNHSQTANHRQQSIGIAGWMAPTARKGREKVQNGPTQFFNDPHCLIGIRT